MYFKCVFVLQYIFYFINFIQTNRSLKSWFLIGRYWERPWHQGNGLETFGFILISFFPCSFWYFGHISKNENATKSTQMCCWFEHTTGRYMICLGERKKVEDVPVSKASFLLFKDWRLLFTVFLNLNKFNNVRISPLNACILMQVCHSVSIVMILFRNSELLLDTHIHHDNE